jgi:hypothetical protein
LIINFAGIKQRLLQFLKGLYNGNAQTKIKSQLQFIAALFLPSFFKKTEEF